MMAEGKSKQKHTSTSHLLLATNLVISHWSLVKAGHMAEPSVRGGETTKCYDKRSRKGKGIGAINALNLTSFSFGRREHDQFEGFVFSFPFNWNQVVKVACPKARTLIRTAKGQTSAL